MSKARCQRSWRVGISGLVGLSLLGVPTLADGSVGSAAATGGVVSVLSSLLGDEAVAALESAEATGQRVEVAERRTERSRVLMEPDGRVSVEVFSEPRWVEDGDGVWVDVDGSLVEAADGGFEVAAGISPVGVSAGDTSDGEAGLAWVGGVDSAGRPAELTVGWSGNLPTADVDGAQAVFHNVTDLGPVAASVGEVDVEVVARPDGFSHNVVLGARSGGDVVLRFPLTMSDGLYARVGDGGLLEIVDGDGVVVFSAPAPIAWDSVGAYSEVEASFEVLPGGGQVLVLTTPGVWLDDPARVFPVTVDPTWTSSQVGSLWIHEPAQSGREFAGPLKVGRYSGSSIGRAYLAFDWDATALAGIVVEDAELSLTQVGVTSCAYQGQREVEARRVTGSWHPLEIRWDHEPESIADGDPAVFSAYGCGQSVSPVVKVDVTDTVQRWADGQPNLGISLRAGATGEATNGSGVMFADAYSTSPGQVPSLVVTYAPPVALGSIQGTVVSGSNAPVVGGEAGLWRWPDDATDESGAPELEAEVTTNSQGVYLFVNVPPGRYSVTVGGQDHVRVYAPGTLVLDDVTVFEIDGQQVNAGTVTVLDASGVSGTVVNSSNQPVEGLTVIARPLLAGVNGEVMTGQAETSENGQFYMRGLAAGPYAIYCLGNGEYLGTQQAGQPALVSLPAFQVLPLSPLQVVRGGVLAGRVMGPGNTPVPGVTVHGEEFASNEVVSDSIGVSDANGYYQIRGLTPGSYQIVADGTDTLLANRVTSSTGTPTTFAVVQETTTAAGTIDLSLGATVAGSVAAGDGATTVAGLGVSVFVEQSNASGQTSWEVLKGGTVGPDGTFTVTGLSAGPALVFVQGGTVLVGRYAGGAEFEETAQPVTLTPPGTVDVGLIELPAAAVIEGEVLGQDGVPAANVPVFVLAPGAGGELEPVDAGQTDDSGHYQVGGLPGGDYQVSAVSPELAEDGEELASEPVEVEPVDGEIVEAPPMQLESAGDPQSANTTTQSQSSTFDYFQTQAAAATAKAVKERWVIGSYNVGDLHYDRSLQVQVPGRECPTCWPARLAKIAAKLKSNNALSGTKTTTPAQILAIQEADWTKTVSVNNANTNQVDSLVAALGADYAVAVPRSTIDAVTGDMLPSGAPRKMSRKNQLIYRKSTAEVVASGAYSGRELLRRTTSDSDVKKYLKALRLKKVGNNNPGRDKVFPWAILKKLGKKNTGGRGHLIIAASIHSHALGHYNGALKAEARYYNSNMAKGLADCLRVISKAGKMGATFSAGLPGVIAGDMNDYYGTSERKKGGTAKSVPKILSDFGWTDLRYARKSYRQTAKCAGNKTCLHYSTTRNSSFVADYIFTNPFATSITVGEFTTKKTTVWYSDHKMIAGEIVVHQ